MLEAIQSLSKLVQNKECFICDFVIVVKPIQAHLYILYVNLELQFSHDWFQSLWIWWGPFLMHFPQYGTLIKPTTKMDYVAFYFNQYFYMMHKTNKCTRVVLMFTEEDYAIACQDVKN
jgi:hypothetical protein